MKLLLTSRPSIFLLALCLLCGGAVGSDPFQKPESGKKVRVFLFAGQSNMEGRADGLALSEEDFEDLGKAGKNVQLAFNHEPLQPLDTVAPSPEIREIYHLDRIFGPELFFGIALSEACPNEKFLLIKLAAGSTSLHGSWNPNWTEEQAVLMREENSPRLYGEFIDYVREVLSGFDPDEYEICAMVWVQGETDSKVEAAASLYGDHLRELIEQIRHAFRNESLPFLLFEVGGGKVVEGMRKTARELERVHLLPQSQESDSPDFYQKMENGHYNYEGMKKLGHRFAQVFLSHYSAPCQ